MMIHILSVLLSIQDENEAVAEAARKTSELTNYTFVSSTLVQFSADDKNGQDLKGKFDASQGMLTSAGKTEIARMGKKWAVNPEGSGWTGLKEAWEKGGRGNEKDLKEGLEVFKLPHEELKGFEKNVKTVRKFDGGDKTTLYMGSLSADGIRFLLPARIILEKDPKTEVSGTAQLWVNEQGVIVKMEIDLSLKIPMEGKAVDATIKGTRTLSDIGKTKVLIPQEAVEKLADPLGGK